MRDDEQKSELMALVMENWAVVSQLGLCADELRDFVLTKTMEAAKGISAPTGVKLTVNKFASGREWELRGNVLVAPDQEIDEPSVPGAELGSIRCTIAPDSENSLSVRVQAKLPKSPPGGRKVDAARTEMQRRIAGTRALGQFVGTVDGGETTYDVVHRMCHIPASDKGSPETYDSRLSILVADVTHTVEEFSGVFGWWVEVIGESRQADV